MKKTLREAIKVYGKDNQIEMIIEECSELIMALQKNKRYNTKDTYINVCEEIADVDIMIEQAKMMFDDDLINHIKKQKIERLKERLKK